VQVAGCRMQGWILNLIIEGAGCRMQGWILNLIIEGAGCRMQDAGLDSKSHY